MGSPDAGNCLSKRRKTTADGAAAGIEILKPLPPRDIDPKSEEDVAAVESILNYKFKDSSLLLQALTHCSCADWPSYQCLEFVGDAVLCIAFTKFLFLSYPYLEPGRLSQVRAANISTEKLARAAVRHHFHRHIRLSAPSVEANMEEFAKRVQNESDTLSYGGSTKAPKQLANIVESVAAAVYIDCDFDLETFWTVFRGVLEPVAMLDDLKQHPQPVTMLYEFCQKNGSMLEFEYGRKDLKNVASVVIDGKFVASGISSQKEIAKINAAKEALQTLPEFQNWRKMVNGDPFGSLNKVGEIEKAKQKLNELCEKKRMRKPVFRVEEEFGPAHDKRFVCAVEMETTSGILVIIGDARSRIKDAENCAASMMLLRLQNTIFE
ncbi:ribonuclease 3-like protein 2 [Malania oleifera]|uniref:ribonuclease 3-like protein 2 n=1 Tax=Malania oleifera TaxID=397392 RepID=UPI0025ADF755|nr:ribonuclease 3-like protein 2 [Malania oleifera]XP_057962895.1 ribonuclease 3-like protein 2 [Malania oleifera]XP_057962896.1 ribonuclease 3-like protein 2 [Malania oleifera]